MNYGNFEKPSVGQGDDVLEKGERDNLERSLTGEMQLNIASILEAAALECPQRVAVNDGEGCTSYHELEDAANSLASQFLAHGTAPLSRVVVCLGNGPK